MPEKTIVCHSSLLVALVLALILSPNSRTKDIFMYSFKTKKFHWIKSFSKLFMIMKSGLEAKTLSKTLWLTLSSDFWDSIKILQKTSFIVLFRPDMIFFVIYWLLLKNNKLAIFESILIILNFCSHNAN